MAERSSSESAGLFRGRGWVVILRGLTAVAFGVLAVAWPHMTRTTLTLLFGIYALMHAVLSILAAIGSRGQRGCLLLTTEGMVGLWAGLSTLRTSSASPMAFVFFVWGWAVITGVLRIAEAIRLRKEISGDVWLALSGLVTVLFGLMLALRPILGAIRLALFIAFFALIWGFIEILLGWELQSVRHGRPAGGA